MFSGCVFNYFWLETYMVWKFEKFRNVILVSTFERDDHGRNSNCRTQSGKPQRWVMYDCLLVRLCPHLLGCSLNIEYFLILPEPTFSQIKGSRLR